MKRFFCGSLVLSLFLAATSETRSASIYWCNFDGGQIRRANPDGTGQMTILGGRTAPIGPALDLAHGQIYWSESTDICRAPLAGGALTVLIGGLNSPGVPALDLTGGRLYWSDPAAGDIQRANLNGTGQEIIVTNLNAPSGIVLDLGNGQMYWTDSGGGDVRRANLDGTGQEILVTNLNAPSGIALDIAGGKMYWTGQGSDDIRRANLDGTGPEILVKNLNAPSSIALDLGNGQMYWTDYAGGDMRRANLDGTGQITLIPGLTGPKFISLDLDTGPPLIFSQPQTQSAPVDGSVPVAFTAAAAGAKPLFYQWQFNGGPLAGKTNATLQVLSPSVSDTGDYRVMVSNSLGVVTSAVARLLGPIPVILADPLSRTIVESNTASFAVSALGVAPLGYQWRFNGANLTGATSTNLSLTNVQFSQAGEYTAVVTNSYGASTSAVAVLTVLVRPHIVQQPQSQILASGGTASFTVGASGTLPMTFRWRRGGVNLITNIVNSGTNSFAVVNVTSNAAYAAAITNVAGLAVGGPQPGFSSNANLYVMAPPTNQTVNLGGNATFSASPQAPVAGIGYQWQFKGGNLANATNASLSLINVQTSDRGDYSVVVSVTTNSFVPPATFTASLQVLVPQPILSNPQLMPDRSFQFVLLGAVNQNYALEISPNLTNWTTLTNLTATNASMPYLDSSATNAAQRVYRVRLVP